ncbi:hypothetical protein BaRGS_00001342, partial [Batillaria attramentaria]
MWFGLQALDTKWVRLPPTSSRRQHKPGSSLYRFRHTGKKRTGEDLAGALLTLHKDSSNFGALD